MSQPTPYDRVPYEGRAIQHAHPDRLRTMARLFQLDPGPVERARVLELGCAEGETLLPLAARYPEARFLGIDASAVQIEVGQRCRAELGLENIELRQQDILELDEAPGSFDYIICHGVFSWVPEPVRQRILALVRQLLAPTGVAFISYNTYPGWKMREAVREMMLFRAEGEEDPRQQMALARSVLEFLQECAPPDRIGYRDFLQNEAKTLLQSRTPYFFHEFLEPINQPLWFHQFARLCSQHELRFLSESQISSMHAGALSEAARVGLQRLAGGQLVAFEQYLDFLRNRRFRQSLITHREQIPERALRPALMAHFRLSSRLEAPSADPRDSTPLEFTWEGHSVTVQNPLTRAFLREARARWPRSASFAELTEAAAARLGLSSLSSAALDNLLTALLTTALGGMMELSSTPSPVVSEPGPMPTVDRYNRWQAGQGDVLTNHRHQPVWLRDKVALALAQLADGSRSREALRTTIEGLALSGQLTAHQPDGTRITDPDRLRRIMAGQFEESLATLAEQSLLIA